MSTRGQQIKRVADALLTTDAWKATLFLSPTEVVRATRRWYRRRKTQNAKRIEIEVTIGKPNYQERDLVKSLKKAEEPFPVRKIHLKFRKPTK